MLQEVEMFDVRIHSSSLVIRGMVIYSDKLPLRFVTTSNETISYGAHNIIASYETKDEE